MFSHIFLLIAAYVMLKSVRDSLFLYKLGPEKLPYVYILIALIAGSIATVFSRLLATANIQRLIFVRDEKSRWIHYVLGCVGLPWATFCGNFAAIHVTGHENCSDRDYYQHFSIDRRFFIPLSIGKIIGKQALFSLNNAWAKYYQKDRKRIRSKDLRI
jgi:hypothetical protein